MNEEDCQDSEWDQQEKLEQESREQADLIERRMRAEFDLWKERGYL